MDKTTGNVSVYSQLDNAMHFRLDEINTIKDYFITEVIITQ